MFGSRKNGQSWIRDRRSGSMEGERDAMRRGAVWCGVVERGGGGWGW